jgi:exopolysaccharide production protein ExoY
VRQDKVIVPDVVIHRRHVGSLGGPNGSLKRCFDIIAALVMLACFAPLLATIAALIAWRVGGDSVIYAHERVGRGGRKFRCFKFRTMVVDADRALARLLSESPQARLEWERAWKLRDDPRIIPGIGHLLRRSSLDELPQIFNVLTGDMSMVGPRPIVEEELDKYGPWKHHYLAVRPGLTGPWQIGGRSDESYENRVKEDVRYIEQWQFVTDLRIFTRTALLVVSGRCKGAV